MEVIFTVISNIIIIIYFLYQDKRLFLEEEYSILKTKNTIFRYILKTLLAFILVLSSIELFGLSYDLRALYLSFAFVFPHKKFELLFTGITLIASEYMLIREVTILLEVIFIVLTLSFFSILSKITKFINLSRERQLRILMFMLLTTSYIISLFNTSVEWLYFLTLFYWAKILVIFIFIHFIIKEILEFEALLDGYYIDGQTGLRNKRIFEKNFRNFCKGNFVGVAGIIDVDSFKEINDTYGHSLGDQVTQNLAKLLQDYQTKNISFYRIGGDEFAVLAVDTNSDDAIAFLKEIQGRLDNEPITTCMSSDIFITISIGINYVGNSIEPQKVFAKIDNEMYRAKKRGKNQISLAV